MNQPQIAVRAIGRVRNQVKGPGSQDWKQVVSEIVLSPDFAEAAEGLEGFSHVVVLFWMHRAPSQRAPVTKVHPQGRQDLPLVGVLATRSPARPNPLGMAVVRLLERKGNILKVVGLDAIDGTPVVDIKPYFPGDSVAEARVPDWVTRLR